jgi:hypothetical protein
MLAMASAWLPLQSQMNQNAVVASRVTAPVDESNRVPLAGNVHPMAQARFDRGAAPTGMATGRVMLLLQRSTEQQQALTQYLSDVQNPSSPSFHKWLTPAQYGAAFGVSDSDLQTVESWLQAQGFKIEKVPQARNAIQFSGTAGQLESAFHTSIHTFVVAGETHHANVTDPQIPAALAPVVVGLTPLNDFHPKPHLVRGTGGHYDAGTKTIQPDLTLFSGNTPILFVDPADAATIYDTPNTNLNANLTSGTMYDGTGVNLGIVGVSDLTIADVQNYRQAFLGETTSTVNLPTVIVDGDDPGLNGGGVEALLDAEVSGGIAPKAKLYFYTAADTDVTSGLYNAIVRAIDDNAVSILSMSFGECELGLGTSGNNFFFEEAQQAAAQGISFVASAGDGGSAGCDNFDTQTQAGFGLAVSGMASTPWTIAVGGTDFDALPASFATYANATSNGTAPYYRTALKYIPENPWNDSTSVNTTFANDVRYLNSAGQGNIVAGSGGVSTVYTKPAFQTSLTLADGARDLPDVSFFASNGFKQAVWAICSDNLTDGDPLSTYTNCQTSGGQLASGTSIGGAGGTSASAPAFAGMLALVAQSRGGARLGQANTVLYQLAKTKYATVFHDVTVGNNAVACAGGSANCGTNGFETGYNAGTGYDLATGLGSLDVKQLIANWTTVALTSTTTTLQIDGSTAAYTGVHGASLTLNVGVTPTAATGAVAVIDTANETSGGTASGPQNDGQVSIPLTSGAGSASYNGLPGGTYTVTARYGGDTSDASSSSSPISVTITPEASTTSLAVRAYNGLTGTSIGGLTSIPYGSYVFADAQITGKNEPTTTQGIATGSVAFIDGSATLGTANVSGDGNLASWPPQSLPYTAIPAGSHNLTAKYSGDASYNTSTSSAVAFTVVPAATSMTAQANAYSITPAQSTSISVAIDVPINLGAAPGGSVQLTANGKTLATIPTLTRTLDGAGSSAYYQLTGSATIQGTQLAPGSNNVITATYSGDPNYATATATVTVTVIGGVGSFALTNSGNITVLLGATGTSTLTVTPAGGFTGAVSFVCMVSGNPSMTCSAPYATVAGTAAATATLSVGTNGATPPGNYTATIVGTDVTSGTITATTTLAIVVTAPTTPTLFLTSGGAITVNAGSNANNTSTITVTPAGGFTGQVNLTCAPGGSLPVTYPTCSVTSPVSITGTTSVTSTLTITTTPETSTGSEAFLVNAADAATGSITASTTVPVTVNPAVSSIALTDSGNVTVAPGAVTGNTSTITITPQGGFTGQVNLSCALTASPAGASNLPRCAIPTPANISGTTPATATLIVNTTAPTSGALDLPLKKFFVAGGGSVLALALFFGIPARRRAWRMLFSLFAVVIIGGAMGCGGGSSNSGGGGGGGTPGTTAGAYTITVTGTDATGIITSTVAVSVTVN